MRPGSGFRLFYKVVVEKGIDIQTGVSTRLTLVKHRRFQNTNQTLPKRKISQNRRKSGIL